MASRSFAHLEHVSQLALGQRVHAVLASEAFMTLENGLGGEIAQAERQAQVGHLLKQ